MRTKAGDARYPGSRKISDTGRPASGAGRINMQKKAHKKREAAAASQPEKQVWKGGNMLYPLPAVMVSCACEGGTPNIITLAWAGTVCTNPPMVSVSIRPERYSYDIIRETGEFAINLTTQKLVRAMDWCGVKSGRDVNKFEAMHLTAAPASQVSPPLIGESPVSLECRVRQVLELGSHHMFLADVLAVDVDAGLLDEQGRLHLDQAGLIAYSHGIYYALGKQLGSFGYSVKKR